MTHDAELQTPSFDRHMHALGRLCVTWATLDRQLTDLVSSYTGLSPSVAACVVATSDNVAPRCEMLRLLAIESAPGEEWQKLFLRVLDAIRNQLSPQRNRFVHDYWTLSEGTLQRLDKRARTHKPQALQPEQLVFQTWHEHDPSEVDNLAVRVASLILVLRVAQSDVQEWKRSGRSAKSSLVRMRDIVDEAVHPDWSRRMARAG